MSTSTFVHEIKGKDTNLFWKFDKVKFLSSECKEIVYFSSVESRRSREILRTEQTGDEKPSGRERDALQQGARRHVARFGRGAASIRAGALISWSPRPNILERSVETEFYSFMGTTSQRACPRVIWLGLADHPLPSSAANRNYSANN